MFLCQGGNGPCSQAARLACKRPAAVGQGAPGSPGLETPRGLLNPLSRFSQCLQVGQHPPSAHQACLPHWLHPPGETLTAGDYPETWGRPSPTSKLIVPWNSPVLSPPAAHPATTTTSYSALSLSLLRLPSSLAFIQSVSSHQPGGSVKRGEEGSHSQRDQSSHIFC